MINSPNGGTQEPIGTQDKNKGRVTSPETVGGFWAGGYFFARQLHRTLDVPVGMINNAWGGSACDAWIRRDLFAADEKYKPLLDRWAQMEAQFKALEAKTDRTEDENKQFANLGNQMRG